jgi:hypothetical protein
MALSQGIFHSGDKKQKGTGKFPVPLKGISLVQAGEWLSRLEV